MPQKTTKECKVNLKNGWKPNSIKHNTDEKNVNNICIGEVNAERWVVLKKKLNQSSDTSLVSYLLDLAERHFGVENSDESLINSTQINSNKENSEDENCDSSPQGESSDDNDWKPSGAPSDGPLRRSPRTQQVVKLHVRRSTRNSESHSSSTKHRSHRKEKKRKKDKRERDEDIKQEDDEENSLVQQNEDQTNLKVELKQEKDELEKKEESILENFSQENDIELKEVIISCEDVLPLIESKESDFTKDNNMSEQEYSEVHMEVGERVKLKRRKKHRNHQNEDQEENPQTEEISSSRDYYGSKHKKKKHKHGEHGNKKKHHDVRKAPQDGMLTEPLDDDFSVKIEHLASSESTPKDESLESTPVPEEQQQVQRVAIKIKLCTECNSRHLQDACPLRNPSDQVVDSIQLNDWAIKEPESTKTWIGKNELSDDPLSLSEVMEDTTETIVSTSKDFTEEELSTGNIPLPSNSNNINSNSNGPKTGFAEASLPPGLELRLIDAEHGQSVVSRRHWARYTQFGPLVGIPIREMDIPDDFNMKDIWEVFTEKERLYVSTQDPEKSNWLRFIRPAPSIEKRNVAPVVRGGQLYFVTVEDISPGDELVYWAEDHSSAWSKKKMEKTNCGGCNLRFTHPLYYRMHCTVFHDPNYSLTIRKYHCKVCGATVLGKENIMRHAAERHDGKGAYQCQFCRKFFLRLNYLEMHRTYGCAANPQRTRPLCDFCGRKFCQPQKLKVHIKRMHSDMAEVLREFQCKICLKLLGSRAALQRHLKEVHHKDIIGACTCDRCGKMFQNKSNLKIHMLTHSGVKPFRCKEANCSAAFTTKQCLQFHYKKVHSLSDETMPPIERSVAYTFDAYSGGIVDDPGRGKPPRFDKQRRPSNDNNSSSQVSLDDNSSSIASSTTAANITDNSISEQNIPGLEDKGPPELSTPPTPQPITTTSNPSPPTLEPFTSVRGLNTKVVSKGSKKWMGDILPSELIVTKVEENVPPPPPPPPILQNTHHHHHHHQQQQQQQQPRDVYEFDEEKDPVSVAELCDEKLVLEAAAAARSRARTLFRRPESSNASLLVEAALDAAARDIDLSGVDTKTSQDLYPLSLHNSSASPSETTGASDAYGFVSPRLHTYALSSTQDELPSPEEQQRQQLEAGYPLSPAPTPVPRTTHLDSYSGAHLHKDRISDNYSLHHKEISPSQTPTYSLHHHKDISPSDTPNYNLHHQQKDISPTSTPNYNLHHQKELVSSSSPSPRLSDTYLHHQKVLVSPSVTPEPPRVSSHLLENYALHHQDEQNYALHHQDELTSPAPTPAPTPRYNPQVAPLSDDEEAQNLSLGLKEKLYKQYEALERSATAGFEPLPELQGLDMTRTGYHHPSGFVSPRYPHPLYSPTGYHSVDLSLHHHPHSPPMAPVISSPPPHPTYQGYSTYHPPRSSPSPYHHYSGYY